MSILARRNVKMGCDIQKADLWKRLSAGLFDFILIGILCVGIMCATAWAVQYDKYKDGMDACYEKYETKYEQMYGVDCDISEEDYNKLSEDKKELLEKALSEANAELQKDGEAAYYYTMTLNLSLIVIVSGIVLSHVILELIVPMLIGNGQTIGKKVFGIGIIRSDSVKVSFLQMFIRTVLGKCTVEALIPAMLIFTILFNQGSMFDLILLFGLPLAQIVIYFVSRDKTLIHDMMAQTVAVDIASQRIFNSAEELLEYKKKLQAEIADRADY